jgi:hypothetical protein
MNLFYRFMITLFIFTAGINADATPEVMEALDKAKLLARATQRYYKDLEEAFVSHDSQWKVKFIDSAWFDPSITN